MTEVGPTGDDAFGRQVEAASRGEEWAWTRLHEAVGARLRGFLAARGAPDPDAAVGEVLVLVARALPRFTGDEADFDVLVFTTARRHLDDDPRRVLGQTPAAPAPGVPGHVPAVLDQIDPVERDAVLLAVAAGLSSEQVGAVLGLDTNSVEAITRRGLSSLSRVLF